MKQDKNTVQWYKQRFELLCYETNYPKQVWGAEFYQGLSAPVKDKLAGVAYIDFDNYEMVAQLAVQFDENFHMQQLQEMADYSSQGSSHGSSGRYQSPSYSLHAMSNMNPPTPLLTDSNGKISQEIKNYGRNNNLCMLMEGIIRRTYAKGLSTSAQ